MERIGKCTASTEEEVYKYVYQLLAVMYRCSKEGKAELLHENHRRIIEDSLMKALDVYFMDYERYQNELLKLDQKDEISLSSSSNNMNRHMFCKYPFLKPFMNQ